MHARNVGERLRNSHPARQRGDIGNEADIGHELIALDPRVASHHSQLSLVWREAQNRIERGRFAGAVGTDEPENAAFFHAQIDAIQRNGCPKGLAEATCFYACHSFSAPSLHRSAHHPIYCPTYCLKTTRGGFHSAVLPVSSPGAEWLRIPWAIGRPKTFGARPAAADCERQF